MRPSQPWWRRFSSDELLCESSEKLSPEKLPSEMEYPLVYLLVTLTPSNIEFSPKERETLENLLVVWSKVKDPNTVVPSPFESVIPEKLLMGSADADSDTTSTNNAQMPINLQYLLTSHFRFLQKSHQFREFILVARFVKGDNYCNLLQALATST